MKSVPARIMDYHLHSRHSMDGRQTVEEICLRAMELGLQEICFTEHIEPHHPDPKSDIPPVYSKWLAEIESMRTKYPELILRQGLEIGDNPPYRNEILQTLQSLPLDFHLLSLHLVDNVDPFEPVFFEGKSKEAAYRRYVECRAESVLSFPDYDSIAHLGYVCKFAPYPPTERPLRYCHAPDEFDAIFKHLAQNGKAMEINTSGLRATDSPIPGADLIKRYLELGGEFFTFGSDAHAPDQLYSHVEKAKEIARTCGAKWQVSFVKRKMQVWAI